MHLRNSYTKGEGAWMWICYEEYCGGPPAAEFVKDTKLIESSIGVADRVGNKAASAIDG